MKGEADVHTALADVAATAAIERPPAEDLALRQRIAPEQKELLGGLPSTRGDDSARPKGAGPRAKAPRPQGGIGKP